MEVVPDRLGKPSVREEREWPKPKKDAQYDDDALLDYHSLLILFVLLVTSVVLYFAFPEAVVWSNPAYVWTTFLLSLVVVYQVALFIEMSLLKLLSLASGSRVWKVYFYSQALHETLGNVLTILYVMWLPVLLPLHRVPYRCEAVPRPRAALRTAAVHSCADTADRHQASHIHRQSGAVREGGAGPAFQRPRACPPL